MNLNFKKLFKSTNPCFPEDLEGLIQPIFTERDSMELERIPSTEEVRKTVWEMHELKAPGPDGLQGVFYKRYWSIVGDALVCFIKDFFEGGKLDPKITFAHVVLIPKSAGAETFDKFRPISLCNFSFKVITRIITARLRKVLAKIISPFQSAFVPGRWIVENAILVREVLHKMKKKRVKKALLV